MVARNDVTGDAIQSKATSTAYRDNYELIFRKNQGDKDESKSHSSSGSGHSEHDQTETNRGQ